MLRAMLAPDVSDLSERPCLTRRRRKGDAAMKASQLLVALALVTICPVSAATEPAVPEPAEALAKRAGRELSKAGDDAEFDVVIRVCRVLARFDRALSSELLARARDAAKFISDPLERLSRLELLALQAAPVDRNLSSDILLELKPSEEAKKDLRIQLKMLAIDLVLAHRQGLPTEADLMRQVKEFCERHTGVMDFDVRTYSSDAFADYVSRLESGLGIRLWQDIPPKRAWRDRLNAVRDMVHYRHADAVKEIRKLLKVAHDEEAQGDAAVVLYKAGLTDEAIARLRQIEYTERARISRSLLDLTPRVAAVDPEQATRIALSMGSEFAVRSAMNAVAKGGVANHPRAILELLKYQDNKSNRQSAISQVACSLAKKGEHQAALELTGRIRRNGLKAMVFATVGEITADRALLADAMRLAWEAKDGSCTLPVMYYAISALGIREAVKLVEETVLAQEYDFSSKLYGILSAAADYDAEWAFAIFQPTVAKLPDPPRGPWKRVFHLLSKLVAARPDFAAEYIEKHCEKAPAQELGELKRRCVMRIARRSRPEAESFAKRVGIFEANAPYRVRSRSLVREHTFSQIQAAGPKINEVLKDLESRKVPEWRYLVEASAIALCFAPGYRPDRIQPVLEMTSAMGDKALADKALAAAACRLYEEGAKDKAMKLVEHIESACRRADALSKMAQEELDPTPRDRRPFLAGWRVARPR